MFFVQKIRPVIFVCALAFAAAVGAFVALRIAGGSDFSQMLTQRKIEESVTERISRIRATQGDILELAVLESVLTFEQNDEWASVPAGLGRSTVRLSVPAVFRFFVKISEPISVHAEISPDGNALCTIVAPRLQPVLPVAFDTSRVVKKSDVGILRFNREENADALREKISMRLVLSAKKHAKSAAVRDAAREAFQKFVERWLGEVRELRERPDLKISVKIIFADEQPTDVPAAASDAAPAKISPVPVTL